MVRWVRCGMSSPRDVSQMWLSAGRGVWEAAELTRGHPGLDTSHGPNRAPRPPTRAELRQPAAPPTNQQAWQQGCGTPVGAADGGHARLPRSRREHVTRVTRVGALRDAPVTRRAIKNRSQSTRHTLSTLSTHATRIASRSDVGSRDLLCVHMYSIRVELVCFPK